VRQLQGVRCNEVARALAFVVAVLIDPNAATRTPPSHPQAAGGSAAAAPVRRRSAPVAELPSRWRFGVGAELAAQTAVAPHVTWGPRMAVGVHWIGPDGIDAVSARVSIGHVSSGSLPGGWGDASISWTAGRLEGCRGWWGKLLSAEVCGSFEVGAIHGQGWRASQTSGATAPWIAPGGLVRGGWSLVDSLVVQASVGVFAPLMRPRFYFVGPDGTQLEVVHEVPRAGVTGGLGLMGLF
jgi:hypothetical protein